jgi:hypothetical protein
MQSNLDRYKKDLESLIARGEELFNAMQAECFPKQFKTEIEKLGDKGKEYIKNLPSFKTTYQSWYSEAKVLVRQLLPDRLSDFVRYYEKPTPRKDITYENYRIED